MTQPNPIPSIPALIEELQSDFENKGKYVIWDKSWNRVGYSETPQYSGQVPIRFPENWSPFMCFMLFKHCNVPLT